MVSEPALYSEGAQDEDQRVDERPDEGYPSRHSEVARVVHAANATTPISRANSRFHTVNVYSQSTHNAAGNQRLDPANERIHDRHDPNHLPATPLHEDRVTSRDYMDASVE